jgi:hypothetical protein
MAAIVNIHFTLFHLWNDCRIDVGKTLIATSRPSLVSVARYTSPMPPSPSFPVMRCAIVCPNMICGSSSVPRFGCGMVSPPAKQGNARERLRKALNALLLSAEAFPLKLAHKESPLVSFVLPA